MESYNDVPHCGKDFLYEEIKFCLTTNSEIITNIHLCIHINRNENIVDFFNNTLFQLSCKICK